MKTNGDGGVASLGTLSLQNSTVDYNATNTRAGTRKFGQSATILGGLTCDLSFDINYQGNSGFATYNLQIGNNNQDTIFSGGISSNGSTNPQGITKIGSGTLVLSGNNAYGGVTAVTNGTLQLDFVRAS